MSILYLWSANSSWATFSIGEYDYMRIMEFGSSSTIIEIDSRFNGCERSFYIYRRAKNDHQFNKIECMDNLTDKILYELDISFTLSDLFNTDEHKKILPGSEIKFIKFVERLENLNGYF